MATAAYVLNICDLNEVTWEAAKKLLPAERLEKACAILDENMQKQSLGAGLLLRYVLQRASIDPLLVRYNGAGKPILLKENAYVSLSHSGSWVACALSNYPVGIDVQDTMEGTPSLLLKYFHQDEQKLIHQDGFDSFYQIWCRKECYIKAFGWMDLEKINTIISPDTYGYFDFYPEKTVMGCVLSKTHPGVWIVKQADLLREA